MNKIFCLWTESKKKRFTWASNLQSMTFIRNWRNIICRKKLTLQTFHRTLSELISYCKTTSLKFAWHHHWPKISWQPDKVYSHSIYELSKSIDSYRAEIFFQTKFISIRVWCASSIHHCLPPTLSKQSSMKKLTKSEGKSAPLPTSLDCLLWIKIFSFTQGIQLRCQQALETAKSPQSNLQVLILFVFFAWWGKITTHFYSFQRKTNKN